jgi:hypothetical protein
MLETGKSARSTDKLECHELLTPIQLVSFGLVSFGLGTPLAVGRRIQCGKVLACYTIRANNEVQIQMSSMPTGDAGFP